MHSFFDAWDRLEAAHPFGVMYFRQLFTAFGVTEGLAGHVDEYLFLDLMSRRQAHIRRIKVQARITGETFWVYVDLNAETLSFQSTPASPFTYSVAILPEPVWLVRWILLYYCQQHRFKAPSTRQRHRNFGAYIPRVQ